MDKFLVAIDDSEISSKVIDFACNLATKQGAELYLVHVTREERQVTKTIWMQVEEVFLHLATEILASASKRASEAGVEKITTEILSGDPARAIVEFAAQTQVSAIILGSHGQGQISGLLLGSVSFKVLSLASCTVIVVR